MLLKKFNQVYFFFLFSFFSEFESILWLSYVFFFFCYEFPQVFSVAPDFFHTWIFIHLQLQLFHRDIFHLWICILAQVLSHILIDYYYHIYLYCTYFRSNILYFITRAFHRWVTKKSQKQTIKSCSLKNQQWGQTEEKILKVDLHRILISNEPTVLCPLPLKRPLSSAPDDHP